MDWGSLRKRKSWRKRTGMSREVQYSFCKDHFSLRRLGFSEAVVLKRLPPPRQGPRLSLLADAWHQGGNFHTHICHN